MPYTVLQTEAFLEWRDRLRDERAKAIIARRIEQVAAGSLGDVKSVGGGVSEMRIAYGPGYRLYFAIRQRVVVILLVGGDKGTQRTDIRRARELAKEI